MSSLLISVPVAIPVPFKFISSTSATLNGLNSGASTLEGSGMLLCNLEVSDKSAYILSNYVASQPAESIE